MRPAGQRTGLSPKRAVLAIEAQIEERGAARAEALFRALGELAPEGTWPLLAAVEHEDADVRTWSREALDAAIRRSDAAGRAAILARALTGLAREHERGEWSGFFTRGGPEAFLQRARAMCRDTEHEALVGGLDATLPLVRAVAMTGLACRGREPRVRALVVERLAAELPAALEAPGRGPDGERVLLASEAAAHVVASWFPDILGRMRREDVGLDAILRDYAVAELARPCEAGSTEPFVVALSLSRALAGDRAILDAALERLERTGALTPGLARLLDEQARAQPQRRREVARRAALALALGPDGADVVSIARVASCDRATFAHAAGERIVVGEALTDVALAALLEALRTCGVEAAVVLPVLAARRTSASTSTGLRAAAIALERTVREAERRRARCLERLRASDPATRIGAMDELRSGTVSMDDEIVAVLVSARDDEGAWTFRERDWDDVENEHASPTRERTRRVADAATELLETHARWLRDRGAIQEAS